jgi:hypothetical protein
MQGNVGIGGPGRFGVPIRAHSDRKSWNLRHGPAFSESHLPTARGIGLAKISGEVESIFEELCRGLNIRDFSHASDCFPGTLRQLVM